MKRQERSRRSRRLSPLERLETRALLTLTATSQLPDLNLTTGTAAAPVNLDSYFKDANATSDFAIFDTTLGTIPVLLTPKTTPATVANFESYISKGDYTNSIVHRSVPGFIWQTGGYQLSATGSITTTPTTAPVKNEFGASNVRGTIAMAKLGSDPNSATDEFFFNESDSNAANLDNQNGGFTVFGHVVGSAGLAVMDAIGNVPEPSPSPLSSPFDQIPLQNYTAGATVQPSNLILIKNVSMASELYLPSSDAPNVATVSVQGNNLTVTPVGAGTAHITVVGYGSDGNTATETFAVHVNGSTQPGTTPSTPTPTTTTTSTTTPTTSTPASTPTSAPVATAQPVATPSSLLILYTQGSVPASVVAGQKAKIQETVSVVDPTSKVAQKERVTLSLSTTTTGSPGDITIASATPMVKLKANKSTKLTVSTNQVSASVPAGAYHVLVSVTDPNGSATTIDTGKTLNVQAPGSKSSRK